MVDLGTQDKYLNWIKWFGKEEADRLQTYSVESLKEVVDYWQLKDIRPLKGGFVSLIVCAQFKGQEVVCKIPLNRDSFTQAVSEADYLQAIEAQSLGPKVFDIYQDKVILMEKLPSDQHLNQIGFNSQQQAKILGMLAGKLQQSALINTAVPLADRLAKDHWWVISNKSQALIDWSNSLQGENKLLHMDLHPKNVIYTQKGWKVIDPKPTIGISEFDLHGLFYSKRELFWPEAQILLKIYCQEAQMDYAKALKFLTFRAILNQEFLEEHPEQTTQFHFEAWLDNPQLEEIREEFETFL